MRAAGFDPKEQPTEYEVILTTIAAGAVETFDRSSFKRRLAAALPGVRPDDIALRVSAASVRVEARVSARNATDAVTILSTLRPLAASTDGLSRALGVAVEAVETPSIRITRHGLPAPVPPLQPKVPMSYQTDESNARTSTGAASSVTPLAIGLSLGALFLLAVALLVIRRRMQRERASSGRSKAVTVVGALGGPAALSQRESSGLAVDAVPFDSIAPAPAAPPSRQKSPHLHTPRRTSKCAHSYVRDRIARARQTNATRKALPPMSDAMPAHTKPIASQSVSVQHYARPVASPSVSVQHNARPVASPSVSVQHFARAAPSHSTYVSAHASHHLDLASASASEPDAPPPPTMPLSQPPRAPVAMAESPSADRRRHAPPFPALATIQSGESFGDDEAT